MIGPHLFFNESSIADIRKASLLHALDDILVACNSIAYDCSPDDDALIFLESIVSNVVMLSDHFGLDNQLQSVFKEVLQ